MIGYRMLFGILLFQEYT